MTTGGRGWRRVARILVWSIVSLPLLWLLWFGLDLIYVATDNETDYSVPADVIIVLGCPSYEGNIISTTFSTCVQARAHQAARLYHRGLAAHIIPTGGFTGPLPSEAGAMAQVLRADGVPDDAITLEEQARDTVQNIQYSRAIMRARGWDDAILVTDPHHIKRATVVARDAGLTVYPSPSTDSPAWHNPDARRQNLARDARALMTYQLGRLQSGPP
ncbi:MAG TPA: YdcF family protein [Chloroflexia bacterium]|nr:YdcF family protein [Chloroflexia bacterium]